MKKSFAFYSIIFFLAVGLFAYPVAAQTTEAQTSEEIITPSTDLTLSEEYQEGYREGFNAGFAQGRAEAAGEVRGYRPGDSTSDAVRGYEGAEPPTREAPTTSGGRWHVPGVDSKVTPGGPGN